jgi:hypothetical protein
VARDDDWCYGDGSHGDYDYYYYYYYFPCLRCWYYYWTDRVEDDHD